MMLALALLLAAVSEIRVDLKLDGSDFVAGERIRAVVDIANSSTERVGMGVVRVFSGPETNRYVKETLQGEDRLFVEVYRSSDMVQLTRLDKKPFVLPFSIASSEGQKLETFLGDHYALREMSRYLAKPVFVHKGMRYEGALRAFDVVEGIKVVSALQMFTTRPGLRREFVLSYWSRNHSEHLFLSSRDQGDSDRTWETRDLGPILRIEKPSLSILPSGKVIVLHRLNQDQFIRSEFWSVPQQLKFHMRETVRDPATAGTARVREMYKDGGVKPRQNPWWKFW